MSPSGADDTNTDRASRADDAQKIGLRFHPSAPGGSTMKQFVFFNTHLRRISHHLLLARAIYLLEGMERALFLPNFFRSLASLPIPFLFCVLIRAFLLIGRAFSEFTRLNITPRFRICWLACCPCHGVQHSGVPFIHCFVILARPLCFFVVVPFLFSSLTWFCQMN